MSDVSVSLDSVVAAAVAEHLKLDPQAVASALELLDQGRPIPYLARYRREAVGGLDEPALRAIRAESAHVREMEQRREFILRAMSEREGVAPRVLRRVERCRNRLELEYLYEPYRPPRKTPGSLARDQGLEPLAEGYLKNEVLPVEEFAGEGKGVPAAEDAQRGAREILAERFAADPEVRGTALRVIEKEGTLFTAPPHGKDAIPDRYGSFRNYRERLAKAPSHRFLGLRRAEKEGALTLQVEFPEERIRAAIERRFYPKECADEAREALDQAAALAVRLLRPAVMEDALRETRDRAEADALGVFRRNLHDLLLFPPAGAQRVMSVDPAPRGLVPVACVDERGEPLEHARLRLFDKKDPAKVAKAREEILRMIRDHEISILALGNGRGRHECEAFLHDALDTFGENAPAIIVVNEVGVGGYASGPLGRAELPTLPVPARAAVSLARRLMDPLRELVKMDLRQVGQYQQDIEPAKLNRALREVVEHCVNHVGVDVNRASHKLLSYVCGFTAGVARALFDHRMRTGPIRTLPALRDLPFISDDTFEQGAGFLRILGGENPLDATGVHPDHYPLVERIAQKLGEEPGNLVGNTDLLADLVAEEFADETFSPSTVEGVLFELLDGGRDPRPNLEVARRPMGVKSPKDLEPGMMLPGRVTNVTNFGAFVDVGVKQDGLVHVSELADHFVKDPTSVARVGQIVRVRVLGVDPETSRISLSMKSGRGGPRRGERSGGRGRRDRDHGRGRSRDGDRRPRRDRVAEEAPEPAPAAAAPEPAPEPLPENPIPADMSEEEFMKLKLDELRKRFG